MARLQLMLAQLRKNGATQEQFERIDRQLERLQKLEVEVKPKGERTAPSVFVGHQTEDETRVGVSLGGLYRSLKTSSSQIGDLIKLFVNQAVSEDIQKSEDRTIWRPRFMKPDDSDDFEDVTVITDIEHDKPKKAITALYVLENLARYV